MNLKELMKEQAGVFPFSYDGEFIEAPVYLFNRSSAPELLNMEEDDRCVIEDTFFQRNGYFWICYNVELGWFTLHTID